MNYELQAVLATVFTWGITAIGASLVFLCKKVNKTFMDASMGFAAGVMTAASFFSLLSPAISMANNLNMISWLISSMGLLLGGLFLFFCDKLYKLFSKKGTNRSFMLVSSITLHNIPEGLAIGVAFGSIAYGIEGATIMAAYLLALGIGLQNLPEGTAVSFPLRREGFSRWKAFFYGQLSGIVEPIAAFFGALLVIKIRLILPFLLSFAAGAMIYVSVLELIPESQKNKKKDLMALFTLIGFAIMMMLDVALS